ncbi:MAG: SIS domain-containing protein [Bacteroidales bacterium]|jgi:D-sedoheptulose 7-phosphate isomerase|nr:SIS domain-containing protein [Bacteroidales bacterium]
MKDYTKQISDYIDQEIKILNNLDYKAIGMVINVLEEARGRSATIYICGNGGSASTASHFVCDFNKDVSLNQEKKYKFLSLNDNIPYILAIANDCGYEQIFRLQIEEKIHADDISMCISGSGNSKNILLAAEYAKSVGATIIGVTGFGGGKLHKIADYHLHVPIGNMQITEDVHMIFDHLIIWILTH